MADSENSRTLSRFTRRNEHGNELIVADMPQVINRRNLLPLAARILPHLLKDLPPQTVIGPTHVKELWPKWLSLHRQRIAADQKCVELENRVLAEAGGRPRVSIEVEGAGGPIVVHSFRDIARLAPQFGAEVTGKARAELMMLRRKWNATDRCIGYGAALGERDEIVRHETIAGRVLIGLQPYYLPEIAAKLHCMLVMHDPELRLADEPWPQLRKMLRELIQPQWSVIEPQSRLRRVRPLSREVEERPEWISAVG